MVTRRTANSDPILDKMLAYVVLFSPSGDLSEYEPLLSKPQGPEIGTVPHGIDRDVAEVLPALWYCLHLPRNFLDLIDLNPRAIKGAQRLDIGHEIHLLPVTVLNPDFLVQWPGPSAVPAMVFAPDRILEDAQRLAPSLGFKIQPVAMSQLSNESLESHWGEIHARLAPQLALFEPKLDLSQRLDLAPIDLPARWIGRQFGRALDLEARYRTSAASLVEDALLQQATLSAAARLEEEGHGTVDQDLFRMTTRDEGDRLRIPTVVAAPGVPPPYIRAAMHVSGTAASSSAPDELDLWSATMTGLSDGRLERSAIAFITTHRAIAKTGMGILQSPVPAEAFVALAALERHLSTAQPGRKAQRMFERFDAAMEGWWSKSFLTAISRASNLTVYSNFPLGLLRLPGDTAPLSCRVPIAYRPLLPLTRAVQFELSAPHAIDLSGRVDVLVAHCITPGDSAGDSARTGWDGVIEMIRETSQPISIRSVDTLTADALRAAIREQEPSILVLVAHGSQETTAGLMIGEEFSVGLELGPMPPVVLLSACHAAPRGRGIPTIADLLIRQGAGCVLAAQVPVSVFQNTNLFMRFFLYMAETLGGNEDHHSLLELWHRVQASNAVNDIVFGSPWVREWAMGDGPPNSPHAQFMNVRANGHVRMNHVYRDTEKVLLEIADERGEGAMVRAQLREHGYVPESAMYSFIGRPDRMFLRPPGRDLIPQGPQLQQATS
jgi:CHAT domain-containing protein